MEGLLSLAGVALGGVLGYFFTNASFKDQRKEAKRIRQLNQVERANTLLHQIDKHFCDIASAASIMVTQHKHSSVTGDISDEFVDLEFLVRTYIPKGILFIVEIKSLVNSMTEFYNSVNLLPVGIVDNRYELSSVKKLEQNFRDSVESLREEIVLIAKQLEEI